MVANRKIKEQHKKGAAAWNATYVRLKGMGFADELALNAAKLYPNNIDHAVAAVVAQTSVTAEREQKEEKKAQGHGQGDVDEQEEQQMQSVAGPVDHEYVERQFLMFLRSMRMDRYLAAFQANECADMDSIELFDDETLKEEIGIRSSIARRKFLKKCNEMTAEMKRFKTECDISSLLYKKLAKYGLVTLDILSVEVQRKQDILKFAIHALQDVDLLWTLIQRNTSNDNQQSLE